MGFAHPTALWVKMEDRCCSRSALIFFANLCDLCAFAVKNRVFRFMHQRGSPRGQSSRALPAKTSLAAPIRRADAYALRDQQPLFLTDRTDHRPEGVDQAARFARRPDQPDLPTRILVAENLDARTRGFAGRR